MDEFVRWIGEQLDADAEAARAAMVRLGDAEWYATQDLEHPGERYSVRSEPTCRAVARVQRIDGDKGERAGVLDGRAASAHIAAWDPTRVLREIDAKRDLLRFAEGIHDHHETFTTGVAARLEQTLRLFALAYADRPGFREEWAP